MEVKVNKWESSIPHDVIKVNPGSVAFREIAGIETMALSLVDTGFEPIKCILVKERSSEGTQHRLYFMAGIKRDFVARRGWFWFGREKITYHTGWDAEQVKEMRTCEEKMKNEQLQTI